MKLIRKQFFVCILVLSILMTLTPAVFAKEAPFVTQPMISGGWNHALALKSDGTVWAWGKNSCGQLGNGTTEDSDTPVQVVDLDHVISVAAGEQNSIALKSDGTVWTWGFAYWTGIGYSGSYQHQTRPEQVQGLSDIVSVYQGTNCSFAIESDGTVWAWGENGYGQLGDGTMRNQYQPIKIDALKDVVMIDSYDRRCAALKKDGTLLLWGNMWEPEPWLEPTEVSLFSEVCCISVGYELMVVKSDGTVYSMNWAFEDGVEPFATKIERISDCTAVLAPRVCSQYLALKQDGSVLFWSDHDASRWMRTQIEALDGTIALCDCQGFQIALKKDGSVWKWEPKSYSAPKPEMIRDLNLLVTPLTGIGLPAEVEIDVGASQELPVSYEPDNATETEPIAWSSSDPTIFSVENGVLTGIMPGSAIVYASCGEFQAQCSVTVSAFEVCQSCNGTGIDYKTIQCKYCNGSGSVYVDIKEDCTHCGGKGYTTRKCSRCHNGFVTVPIYDWSGKMVDSVEQICSTCNGKGKFEDKCAYCYGIGKIVVGENQYKCTACGGSGIEDDSVAGTCPDCNGSGRIPYVSTATGEYRDVSADAYYHDAVLWAASEDITKGTAPGIFSPDEPCTRAQAVTLIWRSFGCPAPGIQVIVPFTDVPKDAYYADAVSWAVETGITNGVSENSFAPDQCCTRAQIVSFLFRYMPWYLCNSTYQSSYVDVAESAYYYEAVSWAVEHGITKGTSPSTFSPDETCTRAQIVTFLWRWFGEPTPKK